MGRDIPYISEEMMASVEALFEHGHSRAKNHDQRLGQWIVNMIRTEGMTKKNITMDHATVTSILFNMENQELWDLMKGYND